MGNISILLYIVILRAHDNHIVVVLQISSYHLHIISGGFHKIRHTYPSSKQHIGYKVIDRGNCPYHFTAIWSRGVVQFNSISSDFQGPL